MGDKSRDTIHDVMHSRFQTAQILRHKYQEMFSKLFYQHGLFCASHPYWVIFISGIFIITFSFPAFSVLHLGIISAAPLEYKSLLNASMSTVSVPVASHNHPPVWLSEKPLVTIQQVVFITRESSKQHSSNFHYFQSAFFLRDLLSQFSFRNQSDQAFTWRDVCLNGPNILSSLSCTDSTSDKDIPITDECLYLGPDLLWQRNSSRFWQDNNKVNTIAQVLKSLNCLQKSVVQDLILGGSYSYMNLNRQNKAYASTLFLNSSLIGDGNTFRLSLEAEILNSELYAISASNETVHFFYTGSFASVAEVVFIVVLYVFVLLYITFSVGKIEMVKSKWGLGLTAVITMLSSFTVSLGVCVKFRKMPTLNSGEVFPYLVVLIGLENILVLVKAVISTPKHLDVNRRIAKGTVTALLVKGMLSTCTSQVWSDAICIFKKSYVPNHAHDEPYYTVLFYEFGSVLGKCYHTDAINTPLSIVG
ncbi:sterol regulatory element-binding protein cleavage-activating protein-like [Corticium candelabrum]|uniref:sterol regulatory element-binding protein cleavage-activating protein-like n=1 Tax=Corticium candelabrum TaxID=121492 RepID=UPI002E2563F5|nr:sterol regulatory element-binding protein cleavage-activating protein-like [Corticium candelabrum]